MEVGKRIRELRIINNLTQEELASRCELSKGFLSQLENDLATPSLPTLMDIVEALGTTMSQFFSEANDDQLVFRKEDFFVDEKEDYTINWVVPNAQKNAMEPIIIEINPQKYSQTLYPHQGEEFGLVLAGTVTLVSEQKHLKVPKGCTFYIDGRHEYCLRNETNSPVKVLWISAPPIF